MSDQTTREPRGGPAARPATDPGDGSAPLPLGERLRIRGRLARLRAKEYLEFDSGLFKAVTGAAGVAAGLGLYAAGRPRQGFEILSKIHRSDGPAWTCAAAERLARAAAGKAPADHPLAAVYAAHVADLAPTKHTAKFFDDPNRVLRSVAIVLKSPGPNEKGVIALNYFYSFPLFAKLYKIEEVAARYHLVLEPSWSGLCNLDLLCYAQYPFPVFVQVYEPRDAGFVRRHGGNFVPIPVAINWWVDHRIFKPLPGAAKDLDVVMIASWAAFKRHHRFFAALAEVRRAGRALRTALLGYPVDRDRDAIHRLARYYGVADQVELREWLSPPQVNEYLSRAKVNILWSRREGENRAMIEGMFAGLPCIVRDGFNYGCRYAYINAQTGCFATERELPGKLTWMVDHHHEFAPREWVLENMSCQKATRVMAETIRQTATASGERWTTDLAVKVNQLHGMDYWDEADAARFADDYAFLRSVRRG